MSESYGGPTLADVVRQSGRLLPSEAALVIGQLAEELGRHHAQGRAHGDITPESVRVRPDGRAVLAHHPDPSPDVAFVAPEVLDGSAPTPASDLWSLGATIFAVIEGREPFPGATDAEVSAHVRVGPIPTCLHGGPVSWVVALLLNREPAARLTAAEVEEAAAGMQRPATPAVASPAPAPAPVREPAPSAPVAAAPPVPAAPAAPVVEPELPHEPVHAQQAAVAVAVREEPVERTGPVEVPRQPALGWVLLLVVSAAAIAAMLLLGP